MPGNLENDRLLTDDELCPNIAETEALEKQDAKTSKWWIENIEKLWQDCDYICHIPLKDWQDLKKQIGGD